MPLLSTRLRLGPLENNTYVIACPETAEAAVVDVGFEPEAVIEHVRRERLQLRWLLATHAHYDHVAGMRSVQRAVGGVCRLHPADRPLLEALAQQGALFGLPHAEPPDSVVDLTAGETIAVGRGELRVLFTPGHSPGHVSFHAAGDLWSGDVLFAGSIGRTDLPGGSFETLERSIVETLFPLGDGVIVHTGHGEETTLGEERLHNPFVGAGARAR